MRNTLWLLIITITFLAGLPACKKLVDVGEAPSAVVRSKVFDSDGAANAAVVNMYVDMTYGSSFTNGLVSKLPPLYTDELMRTPVANNHADTPFYNNALPANNPTVKSIWARSYDIIYNANAVLEGLAASTAVTDSLKREWNGEAKFVRALNYFYLVNLFGDVPLVLSTDYYPNKSLPRGPVRDVYTQIITDLKEAAVLLPAVRLRPDTAAPGNIRATRWAAKALLARVYLYRQDWASAITMATSVIDSGKLMLCPDLSQTFLKGSPETIFQLQPVVNKANSAEALLFLPTTGMPSYAITTALLRNIEPDDKRKTTWMARYINGKDTLFYPYKYKVRTSIPAKEYSVVLRLAEVYLIRAEASAHLGLLEGATGALADLQKIRDRAGLTAPVTGNEKTVLAAIEQEQQVEFFAEWGHRLFDLKRLPGKQNPGHARLQEVMKAHKPAAWKKHHELWPIPADQIGLNGQLTQNPGYD